MYSITFRFKTALSKIATLLKRDGTLILRDYHPVYTKLLGVDHPSFRANGNYFDEELIEDDVAYSILLTEAQKESLPKTTIRRWTLGEIITTLAEEHFKIEKLVEEHGPHQRWVFPSTAPEGIEERVRVSIHYCNSMQKDPFTDRILLHAHAYKLRLEITIIL